MRVVHVIPTLARAHGGPSEVVRQLHAHLLSEGVDSAVVTTDRGLEKDSELSASILVAHATPPARWNFAPRLAWTLRRAMQGSDLLHIHSVNTFPSSLAMRMAPSRGMPFVVQPHGGLGQLGSERPHKKIYQRFIDRNFRGAAAVIASSPKERSLCDAALGQPKSVEVPLGVDSALFDAAPKSSAGDLQVLFLGRLAQVKRVDLAIRAFALSRVASSGAKLVIAGPVSPDLRYDPRRIAADAGVADCVVFTGPVGAATRRKLYADSDVFLMPSRSESFGMAAAEAMASGNCVIATPEVGLVPAAGRAGALMVAEGTAESFAAALDSLARDFDRRSVLAATAREYATREFSWPAVTQRITRIYSAVLGREGEST